MVVMMRMNLQHGDCGIEHCICSEGGFGYSVRHRSPLYSASTIPMIMRNERYELFVIIALNSCLDRDSIPTIFY